MENTYIIFTLKTKKKFKFKISSYDNAARVLRAFMNNKNSPQKAFIVHYTIPDKILYEELNMQLFRYTGQLMPLFSKNMLQTK